MPLTVLIAAPWKRATSSELLNMPWKQIDQNYEIEIHAGYLYEGGLLEDLRGVSDELKLLDNLQRLVHVEDDSSGCDSEGFLKMSD